MKTARLVNIFVIVFIDMLGFGLVLPLLPYYAEAFEATPLVIGLLVASFAAASLLAAPLIGRLSDRFGRRPLLLVSIAGTCISFLLLGFAQPAGHLLANLFGTQADHPFIIGVLFISRIIDGFTAGDITVAQAYISDVTDETNRSVGLGIIGAAFGLGYIIGPAVGGELSHWGFNIPAFAAASLAFLNLISVSILLPESLSGERRAVNKLQKRPALSMNSIWCTLNRPKVGPLLLLRFFINLAYAIFWSIFSLYTQGRLNLSVQSAGFVMTYIGIYSVLVQGVGIRILSKRFKDNTIIKASLWVMLLGIAGWAITKNVPELLVAVLFLSGGGWILNTIITSAITKSVNPEEIGGTLGLSSALESMSRVIAPMGSGYMLGSMGYWAPGAAGAGVMIWAILLAYLFILGVREPVEAVTVQ